MTLEAIKQAVSVKAPNAEAYRSEAARLRAVLLEVETAVAAGITHEAIVAALNEAGVKLELTGFRSALARARKTGQQKPRRENTISQTPPSPPTPPGQGGTDNHTMVGKFKVPKKPVFRHNPTSDDDILS